MELQIAEHLLAGNASEALATRFHPLYAVLVALVGRLTGAPLEVVAQALSVGLSSIVAPACALTAALLVPKSPRRAAAAAGLLAAAHPYLARLGGQVMAYSLAHACLALALLFAVLASQRRSWRWAAVAGCAVGLGYMARSDALATGFGLGAGIALGALLGGRGQRGRDAIALPLAFLVGTLLCMSPFLLAIRAHTGTWQLSPKKRVAAVFTLSKSASAPPPMAPDDLSALIHAETGHAPPSAAGHLPYPRAQLYAVRVGLATAFPSLVILAVFAFLGPARGPPTGWWLPCLAGVAFLVAHGFLKANWNTTSRIHQSALGVLVVPLAARGLVLWAAWIAHRLRRRARVVAAAALAAVLVVGPVSVALEPNRLHYGAEADVGEWIRRDFVGPGAPVVCGWDSLVPAYRAGARFVPVPPGPAASSLAAARRAGADYLVIFLRSHGALPGTLEAHLAAEGLGRPDFRPETRRKRGDVRYTWLVFRLR